MTMNIAMNDEGCTATLPGDVADQILVTALRLLVAPANNHALPDINANSDARSIHRILTVVQPSSSDVQHAALMLMWWIDLDVASGLGRVDLLKALVHVAHRYPRHRPLKYSPSAVDAASKAGHVCVLNWWLRNRQEKFVLLTYTADAFDTAAANGHMECLQWWMHQSLRHGRDGLKLKSSHRAVDLASASGHTHVLQWLLTHAEMGHFTFRVTIEGIAAAVKHDFGRFEGRAHPTLEWWLGARIKNEYFTVEDLGSRCKSSLVVVTPAVQAAMCGDLKALEVLDRRSPFMPRHKDFDLVAAACRSGRVEVVEWCGEQVMPLPGDPYDDRNWYGIATGGENVEPMSECFVSASEGGHVHVLERLKERHGGLVELIPGSVVERALVAASREDHAAVLDWWNPSMCPADALVQASSDGRVVALRWWKDWAKEHGQQLQCTEKATSLASKKCQLSVLEWWLNESRCELRVNPQEIVAITITAAHIPVLEFWKHHGTLACIKSLPFRGQDLVVLDWWSQQPDISTQWLVDDLSPPVPYLLYFCLARPSHSVIPACKWLEYALDCHDPMLLAALGRSRQPLMDEVSESVAARALEAASYRGKLDFLSWWVSASGLSVPTNGRYLEYASAGGQAHVLTWWSRYSGVALTNVDAHLCLELAKWSGKLEEVMAWWYESVLFGQAENDRREQNQSESHRQFILEAALCREISVLSKRYSER